MSFTAWLLKSNQGIKDAVKRYNNRNFMDATVAACALVANADGEISSEEKQKMAGFIKRNEALSVFNVNTVVERFNEFAGNLEFDKEIGKAECLKSIERLKSDQEASKLLVRVCCAVGAADGNFDDSEKAVVRDICRVVGLNPAEFSLT